MHSFSRNGRRVQLMLFFVSMLFIAFAAFFFVSLFQPQYGPIQRALFYIRSRSCKHPVFTQALEKLVSSSCERLNTAGIDYWLDAGTLLGAMREDGIIRHDTDADIAYLVDDIERVLQALGSRFKVSEMYTHEGVKPGSQFVEADLIRYGVDKQSGTVDRVLAEHENGVMDKAISWYSSQIPMDTIFPTRVLGGNGPLSHCRIPNRPEDILRLNYGPKWMEKVECDDQK